MFFYYKCLILVLTLINIICGQCPSINEFSSSDGAFYAMMTVPFPHNHNNIIKFHVQLSIGALVSKQDFDNKLLPLGTITDIIEKQQPLSYKLLWPPHLNSVTRKITQITVNNQIICSSDRLDPNDFNTGTSEINLSVTINISKKKSSVISPPVTYSPNPPPNIHYDVTTSTTTKPIKQNSKISNCYMRPLSNTLIYNGDSTEIGDYPFLGALVERKDGRNVVVSCGVTLITEKLVLTAAHCVQEPSIKNSLLIFGLSNIDDSDDDNRRVRKIKNYVIHPDYKNTTSDADLAIFELTKKLVFSEAIHAACLCDFQDCFKNNVYQRGVVAGWGKNENGVPSRTLKKITTNIVADEVCLRSADQFISITSSRTFCAGDRNGNGPCKGDSGSGFYMQLNGRWIIKGIVSRSIAREDGECNLDEYIVYVDVSKHFNWVKRYIDAENFV